LLTDHLVKASRLGLLGQMSTEVSHQLNQPLQAMLNYCNMMQRRIARGTATEELSLNALANIENAIEHSASIIQRIRDFVTS
jgi:C4-dicarboxylate-specific signal transduction histidine kinase